MDDEFVKIEDGEPVYAEGDKSFLALLALGNSSLRDIILRLNSDNRKDFSLLKILDGFYPFAQTAPLPGVLPPEPFYFGTDGDTNNAMLVRGPLNDDQFRRLTDAELHEVFANVIPDVL